LIKKDNTVYLKLAVVLYKQLINNSTLAEKGCYSEVLHSNSVKLENKKSCMQNQETAISVDAVHGHGGRLTQVYKI